jgi:hypothetical protein
MATATRTGVRPLVLPSSTPTSRRRTVATPTRLATSTSSTIAGTATVPLGAQYVQPSSSRTVCEPLVTAS